MQQNKNWINTPDNTNLLRPKSVKQLARGIAVGLAVLAITSLYGCLGGGGGDDSDTTVATPITVVSPLVKQLDSGTISGKSLTSGVKAFFGIPYAAPPVGSLRWKEPQTVASWTGTLKTEQFGNACAQASGASANGDTISEDCLYVNVWVPPTVEKGAKVPVVVYVHGGAFKTGSASPVRFAGEQLAKKGVVYVSMNYRLGIFGNLALPELTAESSHKASGNYQILDIIAALKWVQRNIDTFGGDPSNVTISGQSSGGIEMGILNVSPLAKGLFHKIVAQSGWPGPWGSPATLATAETNGKTFMTAAGATTLAELRAKTLSEIVATAAKSSITSISPTITDPPIDGYVIPGDPKAIFAAGNQNDVPIIAGYTAGENAPVAFVFKLSGVTTAAAYQTALQAEFGSYWQAVYDLFPAASDADVSSAKALLTNACTSGKSAAYYAASQMKVGKSPVYLYIFSRLQNGVAAAHGTDNQYWHGELLAPTSSGLVYTRTDWDTQLGEAMMNAVIAFAKTGNPSTSTVTWPAFNLAAKKRLNFGNSTIAADWDAGLDFFATTWLEKK